MLRTVFFALILLTLCVPAVLAQPGDANPNQGSRYQPTEGQPPNSASARPTPTADRWPSFSMRYRETTATHERTYSLDYVDANHWTTTLTDNPEFPDMVGASTEYDAEAGVIRFHNPVLGDYTEPIKATVDSSGNVGRHSPTGWLLPDTHLDRDPDAQVTRERGASTAIRSQGNAESHTTVRPDGIPTGNVLLMDGQEVYRAEVLELKTR